MISRLSAVSARVTGGESKQKFSGPCSSLPRPRLCPGILDFGHGGGSGLVLIAVIAALAVGSGAVTAAVSAIEVIAVVIGCLAVLAVLGGIALLVYWARSGG